PVRTRLRVTRASWPPNGAGDRWWSGTASELLFSRLTLSLWPVIAGLGLSVAYSVRPTTRSRTAAAGAKTNRPKFVPTKDGLRLVDWRNAVSRSLSTRGGASI